MGHLILHLADDAFQQARHGGEHRRPQRFEVVYDLARVALREADAHARSDASSLHEVLEGVRHGQIRDVVVIATEVRHLVDISAANRAHRHQVDVREQRALRRARRAARVANHAEVTALHLRQFRVGQRHALFDQRLEGVQRDLAISGHGLDLLRRLAIRDDDVLQSLVLLRTVVDAAQKQGSRRGVAQHRLQLRLAADVGNGLDAQRVVERNHRAVQPPDGKLGDDQRHGVLHKVTNSADLRVNRVPEPLRECRQTASRIPASATEDRAWRAHGCTPRSSPSPPHT